MSKKIVSTSRESLTRKGQTPNYRKHHYQFSRVRYTLQQNRIYV